MDIARDKKKHLDLLKQAADIPGTGYLLVEKDEDEAEYRAALYLDDWGCFDSMNSSTFGSPKLRIRRLTTVGRAYLEELSRPWYARLRFWKWPIWRKVVGALAILGSIAGIMTWFEIVSFAELLSWLR